MRRVADTSFLLAAFDQRDPRRPGAIENLEDPSPIYVPPEVVGEALGVLQKRKGADAARLFWAQLRSISHLRFIDTTDNEKIAAIFERFRALTWVDAAVVHWCRTLEAAPLCFDPDLVGATKKRR